MAIEILSVVVLIVALAIILLSCEVFTNGIEWLGFRLGVSETATGSILAAVGTAMPETIIPMIAIFLGATADGEEIAEGAILGAPFMLGTLAMFIGGLSVLYAYKKGRRKPTLTLHEDHAERDLIYFMAAYSFALLAGLLAFQDYFDTEVIRYVIAISLFGAYFLYVRRTLKDECAIQESSCPVLYATRMFGIAPNKGTLGLVTIVFQVIAALLGIIIGAKLFVEEVDAISTAVGIPSIILAFLIAPVATELPEKFNSVMWYLRGKDTLALGNITGAMVFQSSIPVSIGLVFTTWELGVINIASIFIALAAAGWMYLNVRLYHRISFGTMLTSGSLYVIYIVLLALAMLNIIPIDV